MCNVLLLAAVSSCQGRSSLPNGRLRLLRRSVEGRHKVGIGFSIFLFVIGAILTFAVDLSSSGFDLHTVGIILMVAGLLGLVVSVLWWSSFSPWSRRRWLAPTG
jgi:Na+/proline symporter